MNNNKKWYDLHVLSRPLQGCGTLKAFSTLLVAFISISVMTIKEDNVEIKSIERVDRFRKKTKTLSRILLIFVVHVI